MAWQGNPTNNVPNQVQSDVNLSEGRVTDNRALHLKRDDKQKNFSVTLKDIDETVMNHLNKMLLTVVDSGNQTKVPIIYSSPEKWKSIQRDGFMRDNDGNTILPCLTFFRDGAEIDKTMTSFNKYLRYPVIKTYSEKNKYTKFSMLVEKTTPVHEVFNVVVPDHMNFTYKFIVWTEYQEQMNSIIERINFETNDYWGEDRGLRFRTLIESYSNVLEVLSGEDRIVKTEFNLVLRGYLLPELHAPGLDGYKSTTEKSFTKKKVIIGTEVVQSSWKPSIDPKIKDKWRSQKFPNITIEDELALRGTPVTLLKTEELDHFRTSIRTVTNTPIINWYFPAPTNSTDYGEEGWQSYDNDFYYLYMGGSWKRVPLVLFNNFSG
jgi:hypothetical protein